ncbi:branched-chain amino acid ABC transporter permease [Phototrophicus methaneseepsis]|uniref:Branched-chain amino acid ABC transporter permease n=1 Tax=Phototrophicus methaneseepsis TaxID=2710758 RepID=A0A7S8EBI8_9CHLR|nr:branched-chain amino acid ABC transporter permease [Phototrophicus methaneseepsis]QPC83950.1 branched-chain amino acid ABC transporter permease [Phototrophicus methaneseepsis]
MESIFLQQTVNAILLGAIYALFALGYALVFSVLGVLNLAHSAIFMWGAFIGLLAVEQWQLPPLLALLLGALGGGLLSVLLEFIAFRPLRRRNAARISQLISSIGASILLVNIAQLLFQQIYNRTEAYYPLDLVLFPGMSTETIVLDDIGLRIQPIRIVILVIALVTMVLLQYMVTRTQIGQHMRAVAFSERIASLLGIPVSRIFVLTFFLAGIFGGMAGMLYGVAFRKVDPFIGENVALVGLTAIVLGGMGSIQGAVLGGFIVAALQTISIAAGGSSYSNAIVFVLLFVVLLVRPQGLLGQPENTRA